MPYRFPVIGSRQFSPYGANVTSEQHPLPLNDPQRRHFAVILQSLENTLLEIVALAQDDSPDTRHLTNLAHDLPPGYLARVRPAIDAITEQMEDLAARSASRRIPSRRRARSRRCSPRSSISCRTARRAR